MLEYHIKYVKSADNLADAPSRKFGGSDTTISAKGKSKLLKFCKQLGIDASSMIDGCGSRHTAITKPYRNRRRNILQKRWHSRLIYAYPPYNIARDTIVTLKRYAMGGAIVLVEKRWESVFTFDYTMNFCDSGADDMLEKLKYSV